MDLSIEDELQATVERLRKSEKEKKYHKKIDKDSNFCIESEIKKLQEEIKKKNDELEKIKNSFESQKESLANYKQHFHNIKQNRWGLLATLISTRKLIALSLEKVKEMENIDHKKSCNICSVNDSLGKNRPPTPTLPNFTTSSSSEADDEDESSVDEIEPFDLEGKVIFLENQLIQLNEEKEKDKKELNDIIQGLEEEVTILRDEDSRHALLEQRLLDSVNLLHSLLSLNISRRTIGNLVVEAIEDSINPNTKEISVLRFLTHLQRGIIEYERSSTEGLIRLALQAL